MADSELADLTEDTTPDATDWIYGVDSGGTTDKKYSITSLATAMAALSAFTGAFAPKAASGCRVYRSTNSSNVATSTATAILWDAEQFDTDGYHSTSTNTSRVTIPTGLAGKFVVSAFARISLVNANKEADLRLYKNGSRIQLAPKAFSPNTGATEAFCTLNAGVLALSDGDYLEVFIFHDDTAAPVQGDAGGESAWFSVARLGS